MIFPQQKKGRVSQSSSPDVLIKDSIVFFQAIVEQFNLLSMSQSIHQSIIFADLTSKMLQGMWKSIGLVLTSVSRWDGNVLQGIIIIKGVVMNRCHSCRNTRRQLLMLKCSHDTCIKCAADNYFINCKNKPHSKKPSTNIYYCQKCLEHTELDPNTIDTLRKYFMDNVAVDQNHKNGRREKILERQHEEKARKERVARLDHQNTQRPKSLQIEIAERKRTLSKYLNQKQVDKFIEMQNEYGAKHKPQPRQKHEIRMNSQPQTLTPKSHHQQPHQLNQYEFHRMEGQRRKEHKQRKSINDSFQQFAEQQKFNNHNDHMRADAARPRNSHRAIPTQPQEIQYQIYHNGKGVPMAHLKADRLLQDAKPNSRHSSNSSSKDKVVGTIRSKRSPNKPQTPAGVPSQTPTTGVLIKNQQVNSCKSEDNLVQQPNTRLPVKQISTGYNTHHIQNIQDAWEMESKSTRRQEKTLQHRERNSLDTATVDKILDTFQASNHHHRSPQTQRIKESVFAQKSRSKGSPERQRVQIYYCKIHEDQQIIYFCLKCNQLICSQCALHGSHRSHQIHSLKKSALLLRQRLAHNTGALSKLLIQQQSKQKILRECLQEVGIECARQKQQIRSSFQNFMFNVDKRYKELLKEVEDRFAPLVTEYSDKLNQCRNNYIQVSKVKDSACDALQACAGPQQGTASQTSIGAACNQLGNFHVKRPRNKQTSSAGSIECINRLTNSIRQLEQFLKNSNILLFSGKKQSLLSENSSLRLSDSSNLLQQPKQFNPTPQTATTLAQSHFKRFSPGKHSKKIVVSSYSLNVKSRVKISQCDCIVESLLQMQDIVRAIKPESAEYQLRALQCS